MTNEVGEKRNKKVGNSPVLIRVHPWSKSNLIQFNRGFHGCTRIRGGSRGHGNLGSPNESDFNPLAQRLRDTAENAKRMAAVVGVFQSADHRCRGADALGELALGKPGVKPRPVD